MPEEEIPYDDSLIEPLSKHEILNLMCMVPPTNHGRCVFLIRKDLAREFPGRIQITGPAYGEYFAAFLRD